MRQNLRELCRYNTADHLMARAIPVWFPMPVQSIFTKIQKGLAPYTFFYGNWRKTLSTENDQILNGAPFRIPIHRFCAWSTPKSRPRALGFQCSKKRSHSTGDMVPCLFSMFSFSVTPAELVRFVTFLKSLSATLRCIRFAESLTNGQHFVSTWSPRNPRSKIHHFWGFWNWARPYRYP